MSNTSLPDDLPAPATPDALHAFLRDILEIDVPRTALIPGHDAPFDYLCWSFFEDEPPDDDAGPNAPPPGPADAVVWANRGGGKTFLGALATALDLLFKPGIEVRILGGSLEQSQRMHAHLVRLFQSAPLAPRIAGRITERRLRLRNRSAVEVLAQSQTSVRGTRVQKLRCDEVELFDAEVWRAAQLTTRSKRCGHRLVRGSLECLSTMHEPHGLMHGLVEEARRGRRRLFRWGVVDVLERCAPARPCTEDPRTGRDCPLLPECGGRAKRRPPRAAGHVAIDDAIDMKSRVALATWESEMLCLRPRRTDAVLPEFDPAIHVVHELPWQQGDPSRRPAAPSLWLCGMDFGFRAPTAILWAALDEAGTLWIVDERHVAGAVIAEHIDAIRRAPDERGWPPPAWIGADPAGKQPEAQTGRSLAEVMREAGLAVRLRSMPIQSGLALVRARLKPADGSPPRLRIHARCRELIRSLERYHYPPDKPESLEPVKDGSDHAVDALRYLVVNLDRAHAHRRGEY